MHNQIKTYLCVTKANKEVMNSIDSILNALEPVTIYGEPSYISKGNTDFWHGRETQKQRAERTYKIGEYRKIIRAGKSAMRLFRKHATEYKTAGEFLRDYNF